MLVEKIDVWPRPHIDSRNPGHSAIHGPSKGARPAWCGRRRYWNVQWFQRKLEIRAQQTSQCTVWVGKIERKDEVGEREDSTDGVSPCIDCVEVPRRARTSGARMFVSINYRLGSDKEEEEVHLGKGFRVHGSGVRVRHTSKVLS